MLPRFRVIVGGVVLTLLTLMASGWGLVPMQESYTRIGDIPQVGRNMMQQAMMISPEQHQFATAIAARRSDELQRLRDLPPPAAIVATPADTPPERPVAPPDGIARLIEQVVAPAVADGAAPSPEPTVSAAAHDATPSALPPAPETADRSAEFAAQPTRQDTARTEESIAALPATTDRPEEYGARGAAVPAEDIGEPAAPILNAPLPRANPRLAALAPTPSAATRDGSADAARTLPDLPAPREEEGGVRAIADTGNEIGEPAQPIVNAPLPRANPRIAGLTRDADGSIADDAAAETATNAPAARKPIRRIRPVRRPTPATTASTGYFPDNNGTWAFGSPTTPAPAR